MAYEVTGFLDKNKDRLYDDLEACCSASMNPYVASLFKEDTGNKKETQGGRFKRQLGHLMSSLAVTEPQYIRCIKANSNKLPGIFEAPLCLQQLRYSGVFEAVAIRKQGFPFRLTHEQWFKEYRALAPDAIAGGAKQQSYKVACESLIGAIDSTVIPGIKAATHIGTARVLYRAKIHKSLTLYRNLAHEETIRVVQRYGRGLSGKRRSHELRRVMAALEAATLVREEQPLLDALASHVPQRRLGQLPGLWLMTKASQATAEKAEFALRTVKAENVMRNTCSTPAPENHEEALVEHSSMVATMDEWVVKDPLAFQAPEFSALRAYSRVVQGSEAALRRISELPLPATFEAASEEQKKVVLRIDACVALDGKAFTAPEFEPLRKASRLVECVSVALCKIASSPVSEDFLLMEKELREMMVMVDACLTFDADALSTTELMVLRKVSCVQVSFPLTTPILLTCKLLLLFSLLCAL